MQVVDANSKPYSSATAKTASLAPRGQRIYAVKEIKDHLFPYATAAVHAIQEMRSDYLNAVDHLNWH